jgi:hypothetical protein
MGIKTPPSPASSPPPHLLPDPIKCTPASASLHRTHCSPPSLFSASPFAPHRAPPSLSPPLHRRPHPATVPITKAHGKDRQDLLYLFLQPQRASCPCIIDELHSAEALVAFYPRVHREPKCRRSMGCGPSPLAFLVEKTILFSINSKNFTSRPPCSIQITN